MADHAEQIGTTFLGRDRCRFRVWAPLSPSVGVRLVGSKRLIPLEKTRRGYHEAVVEDVSPGDCHFFQLSKDKHRPDPASHFQPKGVHGPSALIDTQFPWDDADGSGLPLRDRRRVEFSEFGWQGELPDPQDEATFLSAKLQHHLRRQGAHKILLDFYRGLISLRKTTASLGRTDKDRMEVTGYAVEKILTIEVGAPWISR